MKTSFLLLLITLCMETSKAFVPTSFLSPKPRLKKLGAVVTGPLEELSKAEIIKSFEVNAKQLIQYSEKFDQESMGTLLEKIENNKVQEILFSQDLTVVVTLDNENLLHKTNIHPVISTEIVKEAKQHNTQILFQPLEKPFDWVSALFYIPLGIYGFTVIRNIFAAGFRQNGITPLGRNNGMGVASVNYLGEKPTITLKDWAGSPEILEECSEIVSYLKNNTNYKKVGARIPKGILLEGPPGTGKTLLAKAIAGEAKANFIAVTGSEFVELFVGMGAARVRKLFQEAKRKKPAIIFIDEIDALGKARNSASGFGGNDEREQTLNQLLAEMDGFYGSEEVLVIGATNRKDTLDPALLRPGRFDRIVAVPLPDANSRRAILDSYAQKLPLERNITLDNIVSLTAGYSGAQLKNLLNEAAIFSARQGKSEISANDIFQALEKLFVGVIKKVETRDDNTLERVAIHEIGHTLAVLAAPDVFDFEKVTIQSTYNGAGGYTIFREKEALMEGGMYTKNILNQRLMVALGGKAAETIYYGRDNVSLGAFQDLKQANDLAKKMIQDYGFGKELEVYSKLPSENGFSSSTSEYTASKVDQEIQQLVDAAYKNVTTLLVKNREKMDIMKTMLLTNPTRYLSKEDLNF